MLSAISATLFAIRDAMMEYADPTPPPPLGDSPATDCAFLETGAALCGTARGAPLTACRAPATLAGRLTGGALGVAGFLGITPLTDGL